MNQGNDDAQGAVLDQTWLHLSALYEMLALSFAYPQERLADAVVSGEYANALLELVSINDIADEVAAELDESYSRREAHLPLRSGYTDMSVEKVEEALVAEYARMFIGAPTAVVPPYESAWIDFEDDYGEPDADVVQMVDNPDRAAAAAQWYRSCGLRIPEESDEPLDHIATELEFLQYLCGVMAGVMEPSGEAVITAEAYEGFRAEHILGWARRFAHGVMLKTHEPFYRMAAAILVALAS